VPSETPDVIIESVRTEISMPIVWRTCLGSRYEQPLGSLGCTLESYLQVIMFHQLGVPIELEQVDLAFTLG